MFKKTSKPNYEEVETILGKNFHLEGNIKSEGSMRIEGSVEGEVNITGDLVIGESAIVKGEITASSVHISGKVIGNIKVNSQLKLTSTSHIIGDIQVKNFIIDEGAVFQGNCSMLSQEKNTKEKIQEA